MRFRTHQVMHHMDYLSSVEYDPAVTQALTIMKAEKFTISIRTIGGSQRRKASKQIYRPQNL